MPEPRDVSSGSQSPVDYGLDSLIYMPNGEADADDNISLGKTVFQVDIYEHMDRPFLSGTIVLRDDVRIYDKHFNVKGTERLQLTFSNSQQENPIVKRFVLRKVVASKKTDETTEVLIFSIVEEVYFLDTVSRFSKAFKGTPDVIIQNMLKEGLNKEMIVPTELPIQEAMRVVVPYWTPLTSAQWVTKRATTEFGFPYYLYATLFDKNITLKSMEEMFKDEVWNETRFQYSQAANAQETSLTAKANLYNIMEFTQNNNEDSMLMMEKGAVGASYSVLDATTGVTESFRFNSEEFFRDIVVENDLLGEDTKGKFTGLMDDETTFGEDSFKLSEKDGQTYDRVVMANTYNDVNNYYNSKNTGGYNLDATAKALRNIIGKSSAKIRVGGAIFMAGEKNRTVGTKIDIYFPNNNPDGILDGDTKDLKRSGEYVIHSCKHTFADERHTIDATIVKLGNVKA